MSEPLFEIVREQRIAYGSNGLADLDDDLYIKVRVALVDVLRSRLKGARLSAFFFIALKEPAIVAGQCPPPTLKDIVSGIPYQRRAIIDALQFLLHDSFIVVAGISANGEKSYRVSAYAWFGNGYAKNAHPVENCTPVQSYDDDVHIKKTRENKSSSSTNNGGVCKILQAAGFQGKMLTLLAARLSLETAQAWADWVSSNPPRFTNPVGYAVKILIDDASALPPAAPKKKTWYAESEEKLFRH